MPYRRRKANAGMTCMGKKIKTKRRRKDLDEIDYDMKPQRAETLLNQEIDLDLPAGGQNYCLHCAKYFVDAFSLKEHFRGKPHKRRIRELRTEPYTQKEAERAAGMGSYIAPKKRKVETQALSVEPIESNTDNSEHRKIKKAKRNEK